MVIKSFLITPCQDMWTDTTACLRESDLLFLGESFTFSDTYKNKIETSESSSLLASHHLSVREDKKKKEERTLIQA